MSTDSPASGNGRSPSEIVLAARRLLESLPETNAATKTTETYKAELSRLIKRTRSQNPPESPDNFWAAVCDTRSKNTYYRRMASVKYGLRFWLEGFLRNEKIEGLRFALGLAAKLQDAQNTCPIVSPKRRHSKRQDIRGLPQGWRESMFIAMQKTKHRLPFLVLAVAGCRPAELESGITVVVTESVITVRILHGAKVKESQGQPWREITYSIDHDTHPLVHELHKEIFSSAHTDNTSREQVISINSKVAFTSALRRAGYQLWPRRHTEITPYCLRHAFASDIKASTSLSTDEVSIALGHLSPDTKRLYGQAQMSKGGGLRPLTVKAERSLKCTTLSTRPLR